MKGKNILILLPPSQEVRAGETENAHLYDETLRLMKHCAGETIAHQTSDNLVIQQRTAVDVHNRPALQTTISFRDPHSNLYIEITAIRAPNVSKQQVLDEIRDLSKREISNTGNYSGIIIGTHILGNTGFESMYSYLENTPNPNQTGKILDHKTKKFITYPQSHSAKPGPDAIDEGQMYSNVKQHLISTGRFTL